jgi:DNA-binding IclR family transcriptional regulator
VYPLILQIRIAFGTETFGPKEFTDATGIARATAHRHIDRLYRAGALTKRGRGEYALSVVL